MQLFISSFFTVYLLAFQQQNVTHDHYGLAAVTSFAIAAAQFFMIKAVSNGAWHELFLMGIGGALGVTLSMFTHKKLIKKKGK